MMTAHSGDDCERSFLFQRILTSLLVVVVVVILTV